MIKPGFPFWPLASTVFSSGLRGGFADQMKLPDLWQVDLSAARDFNVPGLGKVNDRIVLINAFDRINLIPYGQNIRHRVPVPARNSIWSEIRAAVSTA